MSKGKAEYCDKISISDCPFVFKFYTDKTIETEFVEENTVEDRTEDNACVECGYVDCDFKKIIEGD